MSAKRYSLESVFGRILSPFELFLQKTTSGGILLIVATLGALMLATWAGADVMQRFWEQSLAISIGGFFEFKLSLQHAVNDGLMALFFLLVGLELKREMLVGELASWKHAALPVIAAAGGMVFPASIYAAFNLGTATAAGWGIPMATDIAFAVGILVLLGNRVPKNLILFLTSLAIADDLGAVLAIALFYTADLNLAALGIAMAVFVLLVIFNRAGIRHPMPYAVVGVGLWYAVYCSGVHATIAGVLLAIAMPAKSAFSPKQFGQRMSALSDEIRLMRDGQLSGDLLSNDRMASIAESIERAANAAQSPLQRMEHSLSPWVTFVILPLFALSNAGIDLFSFEWTSALSQRITIGVFFGLVIGKFVGISLASWVAVRLGLGRLPTGIQWKHLLGAAWLGGIGFTMSLFIGQLAFKNPLYIEQAKLGVLLASIVSALIGLIWLYRVVGEKR